MNAEEIVEEKENSSSQDSDDSISIEEIDKIIAEELAKFAEEAEETKEEDEDPIEKLERELARADEARYTRTGPIFHDTFLFIDWVLSPKIMLRVTLIFACFLVIGQIYNTMIEAMSRPTILKPRQSHPFFSNSSSKYVHDYFTGNTKPEFLLRKTDLLVVMYYAPWSTYSMQLKHPYEMVAKFLNVPGRVTFSAINCWAPGSTCRNSYKLMNYPVIAAYSKTASVMYTGAPETDHIYRWVIRLQNHVVHVASTDQLNRIQSEYQNVLIGFFPFKGQVAHKEYSAYAAAGFMLASGNPQDESISVCVTGSYQVATALGLRFEGDIQMIRGSDELVPWTLGRQRTALNILDFARKSASTRGQIRYISRHQEIQSSSQVFDLLNRSPAIFLITSFSPLYHQQDELVLFQKISEEYWKCDIEILARDKPSYNENRIATIAEDQNACDQLNVDTVQLDNCCRSLLPSVDWNVACASSAKYRWEDEEAHEKRRSHWSEEVLPLSSQCSALRVLAADQLVHSCCTMYEKITEPYMSTAQLLMEREKLHFEQKRLLRKCLRFKLAEHYSYNLNRSFTPFVEDTNMSTSIQGLGCVRNDSLQFAAIDSSTQQHLLNKWGISDFKTPLLLVVDTSKELFVVVKDDLSQSSVQRVVHEYHGNLLNDYMLDEKQTTSKFKTGAEQRVEQHQRIKSQEVLTKLTRKTFLSLVDNENATVDQIVFFTGGGWHGPSTSVLFNMHSLAQYFDKSNDLVKFYTIDVTKNELPYNFNFESVPSIVLFLAGRRDVSWKYPEMLPITTPNLISFIVSRCSPRLRWKTALLNCGSQCLARNTYKLRKNMNKIQKELRATVNLGPLQNPAAMSKYKQFKIDQLAAIRSLLRAISSGTTEDGIREIVVNRLLNSEHMRSLFQTSLL